MSADRFKVQLTVSREVRDKLEAVQALMSHRQGVGLERVLGEALDLLHAKLLEERFGVGRRRRKKKAPAHRAPSETAPASSQAVPAAVQADVYERDGGACGYVDPETGRKCGERRWLQLDHIVPRCRGGGSEAENLRLACGPHNRLMARRALGDRFMDSKLKLASRGDRGALHDGADPP